MLIKEMVERYSPTGSEDQLVDFLIHWASDRGFHAYRDDVGNFIAVKGTGKEVLLVSHVDTVPGKIPMRIENNQLYGRGTVDAKGSLAAMLEAADACQHGRIVVIGAVDEEGSSKGAKHLLNGFHPHCIIIGEPSGWNGITLGYKGRLIVRYQEEQSKEHTSTTTLNCYEQAILFYHSLIMYCNVFNTGKRLFDQVGMKLTSLEPYSTDFQDGITLHITFRLPVGFSVEALRTVIHSLKKHATVTFSEPEDAVKSEKKNALVYAFIGAIRAMNGEPKFKYKTGTSDMNILQKYHVPIVAYGPGDSTLDHTPNESIDLSEYQKTIEVLKLVLERVTS